MPSPANSPSNTPPSATPVFHVLPPLSSLDDPSAPPFPRSRSATTIESSPPLMQQRPPLDDEHRHQADRSRYRYRYDDDDDNDDDHDETEDNVRSRTRIAQGPPQIRFHHRRPAEPHPPPSGAGGEINERLATVRRFSGSSGRVTARAETTRPGTQSLRDNNGNNDEAGRMHQDQAYGARIPSWRPGQRQSLYDWAPATPQSDGGVGSVGVGSDRSASTTTRSLSGLIEGALGVRTDPSSSSSSVRTGASMQPQWLRPSRRRSVLRPQFSWERGQQRDGRDDYSTYNHDWSSAEVMHRSRPIRVRGNGAGGENSRDATAPPASSWSASSPSSASSPTYSSTTTTTATCPYELEEAIKYLAKLRSSTSLEESIRLAVKAGFNRSEDWLELLDEEARCDDLLLDTHFLHVAETSWLKVGGIFWGSQTTPPLYPPPPPNASRPRVPYQDDDGPRRSLGGAYHYSTSPHKWTVKVSISSIDYSQLRLTGTMEAFTDFILPPPTTATTTPRSPPPPPPPPKTSITTYLEGELLDFQTNTLQTFSYPASTPHSDATNWRKLPPFSHLSDSQLIHSLVSKSFMRELANNYILMRWKEKCFIPSSPPPASGRQQEEQTVSSQQSVLTIGGFYYLSMRREDGLVRGFYYDPASQPFQELVLKPGLEERRVFPTWEFR